MTFTHGGEENHVSFLKLQTESFFFSRGLTLQSAKRKKKKKTLSRLLAALHHPLLNDTPAQLADSCKTAGNSINAGCSQNKTARRCSTPCEPRVQQGHSSRPPSTLAVSRRGRLSISAVRRLGFTDSHLQHCRGQNLTLSRGGKATETLAASM